MRMMQTVSAAYFKISKFYYKVYDLRMFILVMHSALHKANSMKITQTV